MVWRSGKCFFFKILKFNLNLLLLLFWGYPMVFKYTFPSITNEANGQFRLPYALALVWKLIMYMISLQEGA
jgi:hypothetical protein